MPVEQEFVELTKATVYARLGINAIAFVIRLDDWFSNNQASVLREWQQLSDLWDYVFVVFSHAQALGSSEDQQRRIHEFLDNGRCPQELKQLMDNVNDRFVLVESVVGTILRNGTERNDGLNCGTECFLRLKLAAYHCCTSYKWHFQQVIKRYPKKDKTNLRIDCGFLLVVISNEVLIVGIADSVCSSSDISSRELMHDLFLLVCELFLLT